MTETAETVEAPGLFDPQGFVVGGRIYTESVCEGDVVVSEATMVPGHSPAVYVARGALFRGVYDSVTTDWLPRPWRLLWRDPALEAERTKREPQKPARGRRGASQDDREDEGTDG